MYTLSADIGGTFTDIVVFDEDKGQVATGKSLTTTENLHEGVLAGLVDAASKVGVPVGSLLAGAHRFVHATTQSSNAIFAFSGAKTAVLTTKGFGDTLIIMRASGRVAGLSVFERHHYRMTQKPRLLADERDIFEVDERSDYAGRIVTPIDEAQIEAVAHELARAKYEAVAIAFLFSHKNPEHEQRARDILKKQLPDVYITISSEVAPVLGEYERSATALFNAYVGPVIERYLGTLVSSLGEAGLRCRPLVVQANGGLATPAQTIPIYTVESGPAAGVVGSAHLAAQLGLRDVIATDVGGTTFKVALIEGGQWSYAKETVLNQYQLRLPMIDVVSIGAGGGSIARVEAGRLRVGPKSASATPGPACYGLGGAEPTVTDADVVLGYISPDRFLGGRMALRTDLAETAIRTRVADTLFGGDVVAAAAGIRRVVDAQMADLIRKATLQRGHDPRGFALMAYGGAGPVHAASYGSDLGVTEIIVPFHASVHSAYGGALSDVRFSLRYSDPLTLPVPPEKLEAVYAPMEAKGNAMLAEADVPADMRRYERWVEARYRRQVHTVRIPVAGALRSEADVQTIAHDFAAEYERLFGPGSGLTDAGIEMVDYGVDAVGRVRKPEAAAYAALPGDSLRLHRPTYCPVVDAMVDTPVHDGGRLAVGATLTGPAVIEHPDTTIVLLRGQVARIDAHGNTRITTAPRSH